MISHTKPSQAFLPKAADNICDGRPGYEASFGHDQMFIAPKIDSLLM